MKYLCVPICILFCFVFVDVVVVVVEEVGSIEYKGPGRNIISIQRTNVDSDLKCYLTMIFLNISYLCIKKTFYQKVNLLSNKKRKRKKNKLGLGFEI